MSEVYQQLVLFSQQLTGKVIGLSCGGFFLLTKVSCLFSYFCGSYQSVDCRRCC